MRFALPLILVLVVYFGWYYMGGKEYVELEAIKKWDGKLPTMMPGQTTPFIHVK